MQRFLILLTTLTLAISADLAQAAVQLPNVIFILADDQGWNDIGYNGSEIKTPNLDRLAAEGVKLNQHYAYPTCSPTRVALLGGRFPSRYNVLTPLGATTHMTGDRAYLPQQLRKLGYSTHLSGKWHIGETPEHRPLNYGFDTTYGYLRGQIDPYTHRYKFGDHVTWHRNDEFVDEPGHVTDLITDEAIRVVETSGDKPFFLYIAHHSPHYPLNEPPQWIVPYEDSIEDIWRRHFAAAVTHVDAEVGRLVEALERSGKRDNTLIIYSSDNGGQKQWSAPEREYNGRYPAHTRLGDNTPLRGWKGDLYEGGIRIPAFVNWPAKIQGGRLLDVPTHTCDWATTLITLAGGEVNSEWQLDGTNIWPLITGEAEKLDNRSLYWRTPAGMAVRHGQWKLIVDRNFNNPQLFNLADDPNEQHDRATDEPNIVARLTHEARSIRADDWNEAR